MPMTLAAESTNTDTLFSFAWIMAVAVIAPVLSWLSGKRIPAVVILIGLGMIIGPHYLKLASTEGGVDLLKQLGLGMLFLLAGYEINPQTIREKEGRIAAGTWLVCLILSCIGTFLLLRPDELITTLGIAIAGTSTAIGTLMPIMRQQKMLKTPVGSSLLVHGAIGEILPIMAMALLLSARATWLTAAVLFLFFFIAVLVALVPKTVRFLWPWTQRAFADNNGSTNQVVLRLVLLMLGTLMAVAAAFELDVVLGAFAAGIILHQIVPDSAAPTLEKHLDIVGYSLLIPLFFVCSGMAIDPKEVIARPWALILLVPLIYLIRGLPVLAQEVLINSGSGLTDLREKLQLSLYTATALPIIVAVTEVATSSGILSPNDASLMVSAGSASVLLFPLVAHLIKPADAFATNPY